MSTSKTYLFKSSINWNDIRTKLTSTFKQNYNWIKFKLTNGAHWNWGYHSQKWLVGGKVDGEGMMKHCRLSVGGVEIKTYWNSKDVRWAQIWPPSCKFDGHQCRKSREISREFARRCHPRISELCSLISGFSGSDWKQCLFDSRSRGLVIWGTL